MFPLHGNVPSHVTWARTHPRSQYVERILAILRKMHDVSGLSVMLIPRQTGEEWNLMIYGSIDWPS